MQFAKLHIVKQLGGMGKAFVFRTSAILVAETGSRRQVSGHGTRLKRRYPGISSPCHLQSAVGAAKNAASLQAGKPEHCWGIV